MQPDDSVHVDLAKGMFNHPDTHARLPASSQFLMECHGKPSEWAFGDLHLCVTENGRKRERDEFTTRLNST